MQTDNIQDIVTQLKAEAGMDKAASETKVATPLLEKAGEFAAYLRKLATGEDEAVLSVGKLTEKLAMLDSPKENQVVSALHQRIKDMESARLTKMAQAPEKIEAASTSTSTDKAEFSLRQMLVDAVDNKQGG